MTQACNQLEFFVQDVVAALRKRVAQAEADGAQLSGEERTKADARRAAYADVLAILSDHADAFGLSPTQLGLDEER